MGVVFQVPLGVWALVWEVVGWLRFFGVENSVLQGFYSLSPRGGFGLGPRVVAVGGGFWL
jgi:hypothetical protein